MSELVAVLKTYAQRETEKPRNADPQPISIKQDNVKDEKSEVEPPISAYEKIIGEPYTAKFFNIKDWNAVESEKEKVRKVEKFIIDTIKRDKLEDTSESYKELIGTYLEQINAKKTETKDSKFQRLYLYIELINKQRNLDKRRREIIYGSSDK